MKRCPRCSETKAADQFHNSKQSKDGLSWYCKQCKLEQNNAWKKANPERHNANSRNWRKSNVEKTKWMLIKSRYGISQEFYNELLRLQNGACAICHDQPGQKGFHIDHDHSCCPGKIACGECIRGLLCFACNAGLGSFADSQERLLNAVTYLSRNDIP